MPIAAIADWLITSKLGRGLMLALAGLIAFWAWTVYAEHKGAQKAMQKVLAATQAESARRADVIQQLQTQANAYVATIRQQGKNDAARRLQLAHMAQAHRGDACLDADTVRLLGAIGRRQAGDGAESRKPAHGAH